ncbi:CGNR zinc finger domain-containing protein [Nocardia sp. R16R-3T]
MRIPAASDGARQGCGSVFVDTSRNGRRRFCSTRCSNRVHVAQHRGADRLGIGQPRSRDQLSAQLLDPR